MGSYQFGEFELDADGFVLKRRGDVLPMQPKVFDVLLHLIEHHGTLVTKTELLQEMWADKEVNEGAVAWSVNHIRRALGQRGGRHPIETIPGRGYRFTAKVIESTEPPGEVAKAPAPFVPAFVGRVQVMTELEQAVRSAVLGRGSLCVITGEAGIGKTRCVDELISVARALGVQVMSGRWPQEPAVPTLWPIAIALRSLARERPNPSARANLLLARVNAEYGADQHGSRFGLIEEAAEILRETAALQPSLLILDDLHWADAGSIDLLGFMAEELRELPLCIVATLRDDEVPTAAREQALRRLLRHAQMIPLRALDSDQVAELTRLLARHRPTDALAEAICRASGGIPLFVHEIVRALLREYDEQALSRLTPEAVRLPKLARDLLRRDIATLPEGTIELLSNAAVIGESFDLSLLLGLVELEPEVLLERLEPALAGGQLQSEAPHAYRFVHSLFQSVLYEDLPATRRVAIHRKLGTLLLSRSESDQRHEIARHFYLSLPAGDPQLVMELARSAGDAALRAFAYENAIDHYQWALEAQLFGSDAEPSVRGALLLSLATAQRAAGRTHDSHATSARVLDLACEHNLNDLIVRTTRLRRPTIAMSMVVDEPTRRSLETVLERSRDENPTPARVRAMAQLAWLPPNTENLTRSKQLSARAMELAQQVPEAEAMFEAMRARLFSLSGPDDLDELLQVTDKMLSPELGPADGNKGDVITARYAAYILAGRMAEADAVMRQAADAVRALRLSEGIFYWTRLELQRRFLDGHFDEADQRWKALHAQALRAGVSYADLFYGTHCWFSMLERHGSKAVFTTTAFEQTPTFSPTRYTHASFARIAAEAGKHDVARAQLATLGNPDSFPRDGYYLYLLSNVASCVARLGDRARSEELFALLAPYADLNTPNQLGYYMGSVAYFLGLLCETLGRGVRASTHFEHALDCNQSMGYRPGVVRTLLAQGRLARRAGHIGSGNELLARAHNEAREIGMLGALNEIDALRAG